MIQNSTAVSLQMNDEWRWCWCVAAFILHYIQFITRSETSIDLWFNSFSLEYNIRQRKNIFLLQCYFRGLRFSPSSYIQRVAVSARLQTDRDVPLSISVHCCEVAGKNETAQHRRPNQVFTQQRQRNPEGVRQKRNQVRANHRSDQNYSGSTFNPAPQVSV